MLLSRISGYGFEKDEHRENQRKTRIFAYFSTVLNFLHIVTRPVSNYASVTTLQSRSLTGPKL